MYDIKLVINYELLRFNTTLRNIYFKFTIDSHQLFDVLFCRKAETNKGRIAYYQKEKERRQ